MLEPGLAEDAKLVAEPAAQDVDGETALGIDVDCRAHLGDHRRMPEARMYGGDELEPLCLRSQHRRAGYRFLLQLPAMARNEARRRQSVLEAQLFRLARQVGVVVEAPVRSLRQIADHKAAAAQRHPISESHGHMRILGTSPEPLRARRHHFEDAIAWNDAGPAVSRGRPCEIGARSVGRVRPRGDPLLLCVGGGALVDQRQQQVAVRLHPAVGDDVPLLAVPLDDLASAAALVVLDGELERLLEADRADLLETRVVEVEMLEPPLGLLPVDRADAELLLRGADRLDRDDPFVEAGVVVDGAEALQVLEVALALVDDLGLDLLGDLEIRPGGERRRSRDSPWRPRPPAARPPRNPTRRRR